MDSFNRSKSMKFNHQKKKIDNEQINYWNFFSLLNGKILTKDKWTQCESLCRICRKCRKKCREMSLLMNNMFLWMNIRDSLIFPSNHHYKFYGILNGVAAAAAAYFSFTFTLSCVVVDE